MGESKVTCVWLGMCRRKPSFTFRRHHYLLSFESSSLPPSCFILPRSSSRHDACCLRVSCHVRTSYRRFIDISFLVPPLRLLASGTFHLTSCQVQHATRPMTSSRPGRR